MKEKLLKLVWRVQLWKEEHGQDLIEYALVAGFVAVSAGAIMPGVAISISTIFSSVTSILSPAAAEPTAAGS